MCSYGKCIYILFSFRGKDIPDTLISGSPLLFLISLTAFSMLAPHHKPCIKGVTMISYQPFYLGGHTTHVHTHTHTLTELDCLCSYPANSVCPSALHVKLIHSITNVQLEIYNATVYNNRAGQGEAVYIYNENSYVNFKLVIHNAKTYNYGNPNMTKLSNSNIASAKVQRSNYPTCISRVHAKG